MKSLIVIEICKFLVLEIAAFIDIVPTVSFIF